MVVFPLIYCLWCSINVFSCNYICSWFSLWFFLFLVINWCFKMPLLLLYPSWFFCFWWLINVYNCSCICYSCFYFHFLFFGTQDQFFNLPNIFSCCFPLYFFVFNVQSTCLVAIAFVILFFLCSWWSIYVFTYPLWKSHPTRCFKSLRDFCGNLCIAK